jgi:hypothetical protein
MALHGGKGGSSAPPPDPRLIEQQIKSMGIQDSAIQQVLANAKDMAPLQKKQLEDSISRGTTLYDQSQEDRTYGLQRRGVLTGLQDRLVTDAKNFNEPARQEQMASEAQADVTAAYNNSAGQLKRGLERSGVNVGSGKSLALQNQNMLNQAATSASAANKTRQAARLEGFQLTDRATNAFSGYPSSTANSVNTGMSTAGFSSNLANNALSGQNSSYVSVGGMAGNMGTNATNMYGEQSRYKSAQDKIAADSDPTAALLGAATQIGVGAMKYSDRRLKKNIKFVRKDEGTGFNLYQFEYINGDGTEFVGVMADEVFVTRPDAVLRRRDGYLAVNYQALGLEMVAVQGETA